jgi:hypothetical protein
MILRCMLLCKLLCSKGRAGERPLEWNLGAIVTGKMVAALKALGFNSVLDYRFYSRP